MHQRSHRSSANRGGVNLYNRAIQAHIHAAARVPNVQGEAKARRKDKTRCSVRQGWIVEEQSASVCCFVALFEWFECLYFFWKEGKEFVTVWI